MAPLPCTDRQQRRTRCIGITLLLLALTSSALATSPKLKRHEMTGVPDQFIVVLNDTDSTKTKHTVQSLAKTYGVAVLTIWENAFQGFLCNATATRIDALADDPAVMFVEQNFTSDAPMPDVSATQWAYYDPTDGSCIPPPGQPTDPTCEYMWHLDRVDETSWANQDGQHNMCTEGRSVYAYVIDTGVQRDHPEFETPSRVVLQMDFSPDRTNQTLKYTNDVTNACTVGTFSNKYRWHGTAVASVLAGTHVGVAKTQIVSLKIAKCSNGSILTDDMIDAVDWIGSVNDPYAGAPGVVNHSGFVPLWVETAPPTGAQFSAYSLAVYNTVQRTRKPFFTSANNFSTDACRFAPADRARTYSATTGRVISVGGTMLGTSVGDTKDYRFQTMLNATTPDTGQDSGSNAGACVSIYAPAANIYAARHSAYRTGFPEVAKLYDRASGTSFSSPIVAGIAARYMERQRILTGTTPGYDSVYSWLLNNAAATIYDVPTPAYWFCAKAPWAFDYTYLSNPPATCPDGSWGFDTINNTWGPSLPPGYFPSVGNTSNARMVYYDEGYCP